MLQSRPHPQGTLYTAVHPGIVLLQVDCTPNTGNLGMGRYRGGKILIEVQ